MFLFIYNVKIIQSDLAVGKIFLFSPFFFTRLIKMTTHEIFIYCIMSQTRQMKIITINSHENLYHKKIIQKPPHLFMRRPVLFYLPVKYFLL